MASHGHLPYLLPSFTLLRIAAESRLLSTARYGTNFDCLHTAQAGTTGRLRALSRAIAVCLLTKRKGNCYSSAFFEGVARYQGPCKSQNYSLQGLHRVFT